MSKPLTTTQASALVELGRRGTLRPSSRSFSNGERTFARRTLQALVDSGHAEWCKSVRGTRNGPVTYDGFVILTDAGQAEESFTLRDSSSESYAWWVYCAKADAWMCFGIDSDGTCPGGHEVAAWTQATQVTSCYTGFDEGAAAIIAAFGINADERITVAEIEALLEPVGETRVAPLDEGNGPEPKVTRFRTGYMDAALYDLGSVIEEAKRRLNGVDFDTLVGTGFSGGVVIPALALALGKNYVLIRKETDDSHHGPGRLLGVLGERWVFVDDFVSSGATRNRVIEKIDAGCVLNDHSTTFVGDYLYVHAPGTGEAGFVPFGTYPF